MKLFVLGFALLAAASFAKAGERIVGDMVIIEADTERVARSADEEERQGKQYFFGVGSQYPGNFVMSRRIGMWPGGHPVYPHHSFFGQRHGHVQAPQQASRRTPSGPGCYKEDGTMGSCVTMKACYGLLYNLPDSLPSWALGTKDTCAVNPIYSAAVGTYADSYGVCCGRPHQRGSHHHNQQQHQQHRRQQTQWGGQSQRQQGGGWWGGQGQQFGGQYPGHHPGHFPGAGQWGGGVQGVYPAGTSPLHPGSGVSGGAGGVYPPYPVGQPGGQQPGHGQIPGGIPGGVPPGGQVVNPVGPGQDDGQQQAGEENPGQGFEPEIVIPDQGTKPQKDPEEGTKPAKKPEAPSGGDAVTGRFAQCGQARNKIEYNEDGQVKETMDRITGNHPLRIRGGWPADRSEWPWVAMMMNRNRQFCDGSVIDNYHILTAAHCVAQMRASDVATLQVRLGAHNLANSARESGVQTIPVKLVVKHKDFSMDTLHSDIAILVLKEPIVYSETVRAVCLPTDTSKTYEGEYGTVVGWGLLSENGRRPTVLQEITMKIWNNDKCHSTYGNVSPSGIKPSMMCAGQKGEDSCSGDSGGPHQIANGQQWEQIGVVSWGIGCGKDIYPGVYTRVTSFLPWIEKVRRLYPN